MAIIYKTYTLPDTYTYDSNVGWNAGANSIGLLDDDASYQFTIPGVPAGVVTGLSDPEDNLGYGYTEIGWAFYISNGGYRIVEKGVFRTPPVAVPPDSLFQIAHIGLRIEYFVNGVRVYTSTVPAPETFLLVDASLYSAGDSIADAGIYDVYVNVDNVNTSSTLSATPTIITSVTGNIDTSSTLAAGARIGDNVYAAGNIATSSTVFGTANVQSNATGNINTSSVLSNGPYRVHNDGAEVEFEYMTTFGSNYESTRSATEFEYLETSSESGFAQPRIASSFTQFLGLDTEALILTGGLLSSATEFEILDTISADFNYGESSVSFFGMTASGGEFIPVDGLLIGDVPAVSLDALGIEQDKNVVIADVPDITLTALSGGKVVAQYATPTLVASGTVPGVGRVTGQAPQISLVSTGLISGLAGLNAIFQPQLDSDIQGGHRLTGRAPTITLSTSVSEGAVASVTVNVPIVTATISGTQEAFGSVTGVVPQVVSLYGAVYGVVPEVYLDAGIFAPVTNDVSFAINTTNAALTIYEEYGFDYIVRYNGEHYGFLNNTMYLLSGETDDGRRIAAEFEVHPTDMGEPQIKHMPYVYVSGRADKTLIATSLADEQEVAQWYEPAMDRVGTHTRRIKQPRGVRAHHWGVRITNVDGDDLDVTGMELYIDIGSRRV